MHTVQIYLVLLYYHRGICTVGAIDLCILSASASIHQAIRTFGRFLLEIFLNLFYYVFITCVKKSLLLARFAQIVCSLEIVTPTVLLNRNAEKPTPT